MSTSTENHPDIKELNNRQNIYSPASSYSTYSREIKYIFNPLDDSLDDGKDYCHINERPKQNYLAHTPSTTSGSSQVSNKEIKTINSSRNENDFEPIQQMPPQYVSCTKTNINQSNNPKTKGPANSHMEETSTRGHETSSKQDSFSDVYSRDRFYLNPNNDILLYPNARTSYPVINNYALSPHPQNYNKSANYYNDINKKHNNRNNNLVGPYTSQNHSQINNAHIINSTHHYQQPHNHHANTEHHHTQETNLVKKPPYLLPPKYPYQNHNRRKTWSPPIQKIIITSNNSHVSGVCCSNDSLEDVAADSNKERKSLSDDLETTPPKLAPVSGVLAQKPGQNLIRPVACKPTSASSALPSPGSNASRHHPDDRSNCSQDTTRNHSMKPGPAQGDTLDNPDFYNGRSNGGAFSNAARFHHQNSHHNSVGSSQLSFSFSHSVDNVNHSHLPVVSHNPPVGVDTSHNNSQHNISVCSHHNSSNNNSYTNILSSSIVCPSDENSITSEFPLSDRPDSIPSLNISRVSSHVVEGMLQTPSPSDSGVGELEAMLKEKDAEINTLREVMERNEHAIFQVYEERRNVWINELQDLQNEYERRLKIQSRKSYKTEQVLSLQVYKLQQEQVILQKDTVKVVNERDMLRQQANENQNLIAHLKQKLEAALFGDRNCDKYGESANTEADENIHTLQEKLASKNKEINIVKSQLYSYQTEMEKKSKEFAENFRELSAISEEVKLLKNNNNKTDKSPVHIDMSSQTIISNALNGSENTTSMIVESEDKVNVIQDQLMEIRSQVALLKEEHEKEKDQWLDEKNKVLRYQKQLQLNYLQMQRKNIALENEVQQLTLELENRDMKLMALSGEESVC